MSSRLELHDKLKEILGSNFVYFQPPSTVQMNYPAIVYELSNIDNTFANNTVYKQAIGYNVTVIDKNPDNEIFLKVSQLPMCRFNRHFKSDNLNHYVFTLYY